MMASAAYYLARTDVVACDSWRGNTTCVDSKCMCAESGACALNGQCGGLEGEMTCGGTANGARCMFPFEYLGNSYDVCTDVDNDGSPWCMVPGGLRWGNCECMRECEDTPGFVDARNSTCSGWDGFYCPGGRMYGYTANQTEDVLLNCPLTCKVCFPPPPQPGATQELVFTVSGSVSFTIAQADAENFQNDAAVEEALQTAINELAGDLSLGTNIFFFSGEGVEGLTTFCDESDCDDGSVLKLANLLPTQCSASACTANECCTSPPNCDAFVCNSMTHVNKASAPVCIGAECQQPECCDFRATCSSFMCPTATHVMIDNVGHLCASSQCMQAECCLPKGTCASPGPSNGPSNGPSTGPSTGPRAVHWVGCPLSTHVGKAVLPPLCHGAECSTYECCDMKAICNVTTACVADEHIPKDGNAAACAGATCSLDECCDSRDTCELADCVPIENTHVFTASAPLCWGSICTAAECCVFRASCAANACGVGRSLKDSPPLCNGATCLEDECCEMHFVGYKRTAPFTLVQALAGSNSEMAPADAIARCSVLQNTCGGITCNVNVNGVATTPCRLKQVGSTTASTVSLVSFVTVTCESSLCISGTPLLKTDDLPRTCDNDICTSDQCCDPLGSCDDLICPDSHIDNSPALQLCVGKECLMSECCAPKGTCEASDCTAVTHIPKEVLASPYCVDTTCTQNECCVERDYCCENDAFSDSCAGNHARHCGDTHIIKPGVMRRFSISPEGRCARDECTLGECCNPRGVCMESRCDADTHVFSVQIALCAGTQCTVAECCLPRAQCSDNDPCGVTHVLRSADSILGPAVDLCLGGECTIEECCEARDQCSPLACDTGFTLKENFPALCGGAMCTNMECCDICPFEGLWQSTSVFGGDGLQVLASTACGSEAEPNARYEVQIVLMPMVSFCFTMEKGCACKIRLDELTLSQGQMSEGRDAISWDTILNNDLWVSGTTRRLDAKRYYEVKDDGIVVIPHERRLQLQDIRVDYEIRTASAADALAVSGTLRELSTEQIQEAFDQSLLGTSFQISVYQVSEPQTSQLVIDGNSTGLSSGAVMSAKSLIWLPLSAIFSAVFWI